jgi:hypothetical protein
MATKFSHYHQITTEFSHHLVATENLLVATHYIKPFNFHTHMAKENLSIATIFFPSSFDFT